MVGGPLIVLSETQSDNFVPFDAESAALPAGKYLIKAYVDTQHRLAADPTPMLGKEDYCGQVAIHAQRGKDFPEAQRIPGDTLE